MATQTLPEVNADPQRKHHASKSSSGTPNFQSTSISREQQHSPPHYLSKNASMLDFHVGQDVGSDRSVWRGSLFNLDTDQGVPMLDSDGLNGAGCQPSLMMPDAMAPSSLSYTRLPSISTHSHAAPADGVFRNPQHASWSMPTRTEPDSGRDDAGPVVYDQVSEKSMSSLQNSKIGPVQTSPSRSKTKGRVASGQPVSDDENDDGDGDEYENAVDSVDDLDNASPPMKRLKPSHRALSSSGASGCPSAHSLAANPPSSTETGTDTATDHNMKHSHHPDSDQYTPGIWLEHNSYPAGLMTDATLFSLDPMTVHDYAGYSTVGHRHGPVGVAPSTLVIPSSVFPLNNPGQAAPQVGHENRFEWSPVASGPIGLLASETDAARMGFPSPATQSLMHSPNGFPQLAWSPVTPDGYPGHRSFQATMPGMGAIRMMGVAMPPAPLSPQMLFTPVTRADHFALRLAQLVLELSLVPQMARQSRQNSTAVSLQHSPIASSPKTSQERRDSMLSTTSSRSDPGSSEMSPTLPTFQQEFSPAPVNPVMANNIAGILVSTSANAVPPLSALVAKSLNFVGPRGTGVPTNVEVEGHEVDGLTLKRLRNRISASRCRQKKRVWMQGMERGVKALQELQIELRNYVEALEQQRQVILKSSQVTQPTVGAVQEGGRHTA